MSCDLQFHDFRRPAAAAASSSSSCAAEEKKLNVVQWNIERGTQLDKIIAHLKSFGDADVLILQELDVNCERSGCVDVPKAIAEAMQMACIFVPEFEELHDSCRSFENRIGAHARGAKECLSGDHNSSSKQQQKQFALHGNAILSKLPFVDQSAFCVYHGEDWGSSSQIGNEINEPRRGKRVSLCAAVKVSPLVTALVSSIHLEVFAGACRRIEDFADVYKQCLVRIKSMRKSSSSDQTLLLVLGGDLNTHAHSIVRLSPKYARDRVRFTLPLWMTETELFDYVAFEHRKSTLGRLICRFAVGLSPATVRLFDDSGDPSEWQMPADPFCLSDITLMHPAYKVGGISFVHGKLDWLIAGACGGSTAIAVERKVIFNTNYAASDHAGLYCKYVLKDRKGVVADAGTRDTMTSKRLRKTVPLQFAAYLFLVASLIFLLVRRVVETVVG